MKKVIVWGLALVALVMVAALFYVGFVLGTARTGLPRLSGEIDVDGLEGRVEIVRDRHGIPHVFAQNERDAYFAQGFLHAQDRLWQMELSRRISAGRMAEWFGKSAVRRDTIRREFDQAGAAERQWQEFPDDEKFAIEAYTAGVNAYLESESYRRPPEMKILHVEAEPWRPADSFLVLQMLYDSQQGYGHEAIRKRMSLLDVGHAGESLEAFSEDVPPIVEGQQETGTPSSLTDRQRFSDNWTVSGEHTRSGKPLMANDPHISSSIPGIWYLIHLSTGTRNVVGGSVPGVPGVLVGRNDSLAWGVTNAHIDTADIALLETHPSDPNRYRRGPDDPWKTFETRSERIDVRFGDPVELRIQHTELGPAVAEDALSSPFTRGEGAVSEFRRVGLDEETSIAAVLALNRAETVGEGIVAVRASTGPAMNLSLADTSGDIGYVLAGRIPVRPASHATTIDYAPRDDNAWSWLPYEDNPRVVNPPSGRIVTANQRIIGDEFPVYLTDSWAPPWRARRIHQLLGQTSEHDVASFAAMQRDTTSLPALELLPYLLETEPDDAADGKLLEHLRGWNGRFDLSRVEPSIFLTWTSILHRRIAADEYGSFGRSFLQDPLSGLLVRVLSGELDHWCDDTTTEGKETCESLLRESLGRTRETLEEALGPDPSAWTWERASAMRHPHAFDSFPVLGRMFSRVQNHPGGPDTLFKNQVRSSVSGTFTRAAAIPGFQAVYDLADLEESLFMISGGQSGHFRSQFYDNLLGPWSRGERIRIPTERQDLEAAATLTLE